MIYPNLTAKQDAHLDPPSDHTPFKPVTSGRSFYKYAGNEHYYETIDRLEMHSVYNCDHCGRQSINHEFMKSHSANCEGGEK